MRPQESAALFRRGSTTYSHGWTQTDFYNMVQYMHPSQSFFLGQVCRTWNEHIKSKNFKPQLPCGLSIQKNTLPPEKALFWIDSFWIDSHDLIGFLPTTGLCVWNTQQKKRIQTIPIDLIGARVDQVEVQKPQDFNYFVLELTDNHFHGLYVFHRVDANSLYQLQYKFDFASHNILMWTVNNYTLYCSTTKGGDPKLMTYSLINGKFMKEILVPEMVPYTPFYVSEQKKLYSLDSTGNKCWIQSLSSEEKMVVFLVAPQKPGIIHLCTCKNLLYTLSQNLNSSVAFMDIYNLFGTKLFSHILQRSSWLRMQTDHQEVYLHGSRKTYSKVELIYNFKNGTKRKKG